MGKNARKIFLLPVRFYQKYISPAIGGKNVCIYQPTCSDYMVQAVTKHGIIKGFILGICRLLRCNRLFLGGNDPVPEKFSFKEIHRTFVFFRR